MTKLPKKSSDSLERAVVALLRPLVRLVLKRGMAFGQFAELVKHAYVEAAEEDFTVPGRKLTISRVAVLTGLTRKEASRLMQEEPAVSESQARRRVNRAARVVSAWAVDPTFQDGGGNPLDLPFDASEGPTFGRLVAQHGADVPPRAVLDELIRVGAVVRRDDGLIHLVERAYIPAGDEAAKLDILGTDVADLIASIEHNLDVDASVRYFQRKVAYDNLPPDYLPALRDLLAQKGQALLETLNDDMARHDRDLSGVAVDGPRRRAMVGIYYFEDETDDDA
ncbi:MAG: hypothetical protein IPK00_22510 [Deltaproteobacteria bacterium]|nr:hypothetical protein [Deltaproteobacteria bacterium]